MHRLLVEARHERGGQWEPCGEIAESGQPGSVSDNSSGRREVISFRCCGSYSLVERSLGGADFEVAGGTTRFIATEGTETLAILRPGKSHERPVITDRGVAVRMRWTHRD